MKTALFAPLLCVTAHAQPVTLRLEVLGTLADRVPVRVWAYNDTPAAVIVPCLRAAGAGLLELPFRIETAARGLPAGQLRVKADSPASFELVTIPPGRRVIMIAEDAARCELAPDRAPDVRVATIAVTVTFDAPALRVAPGPYVSDDAMVSLPAPLDRTPRRTR